MLVKGATELLVCMQKHHYSITHEENTHKSDTQGLWFACNGILYKDTMVALIIRTGKFFNYVNYLGNQRITCGFMLSAALKNNWHILIIFAFKCRIVTKFVKKKKCVPWFMALLNSATYIRLWLKKRTLQTMIINSKHDELFYIL